MPNDNKVRKLIGIVDIRFKLVGSSPKPGMQGQILEALYRYEITEFHNAGGGAASNIVKTHEDIWLPITEKGNITDDPPSNT